jgi:hypothetical protein
MWKRVLGAAALLCAPLHADNVLLPAQAGNVGGNGAYQLPMNSVPSSYMVVIGAPELSGRLPYGSRITGISWRRASYIAHSSWPQIQANFQSFDVYVASSTRPGGQLSTSNPMSNIGSNVVLARGGPLTVAPGAFSGGAISPDSNLWGPTIQLSTPFTYLGGDLLIMVRHTGNNAGAGSLDWLPSAYAAVGGQAIGIESYTQNSNWTTQGDAGFLATELVYTGGCYPNCDQTPAQPVLNIYDFICFMNRYAAGDDYANCDNSHVQPVLNVGDFSCFLNAFSAGCVD